VEAEAGSGSDPFSVETEAEARKSYRLRFDIRYLTWSIGVRGGRAGGGGRPPRA